MNSSPDQETPTADQAYARGVAAQVAGDLAAAKEEWRRAVALDPRHAPALYNLAVALVLTREKGAEEIYEKLLAIDPAHRDALYNLANLKQQQGRVAEARALYERLIGAHPAFAAAWVNLAKSYSDSGEWETAEPFLRKALEIDPCHAFARWNMSQILLRSHRWAGAWREYEARLQLPGWLAAPVAAPAWHKGAEARRVLLWNDQGIGDAIQFLRYPRLLAEQGHEVWVLVQETLKKIAATAPGVTRAFGPTDPMPQVDAQAPLLSMPCRLGAPDPLAAGHAPYLKAESVMNLPRRPGHRAVGLFWAGNQHHAKDFSRSADLADLTPLFTVPDIDWFGLQVGPAAAQIGESGLSETIHDLSPRLHDFADTAAALAALDLVIGVDTSVAHLAGALGVDCWLMLSTMPDWRWAGQETASLWYPCLRLFRQQTPGDWRDVATAIAALLRKG